jgi:hypothetical protein
MCGEKLSKTIPHVEKNDDFSIPFQLILSTFLSYETEDPFRGI